MKGQRANRLQRETAGFTLVEMIGVLAIIALLAGMLVPRIMEAIRSARVSSTTVGLNTLRAAVAQYMTKHNSPGTPDSATGYTADYDSTLVNDGELDKEFEARIGSAADVIIITGTTAEGGGNISIDSGGTATGLARYNLDGNTGTATYETSNASVIVEAVILDVPARYAYALSFAIDGADLSQSDLTAGDSTGRVVYGTPDANGQTDVFVYIAHD